MDFTTQTALAKHFGVTQATVSHWVHHKRFPVQRNPPWSSDDAAEIKAWSATLRKNRADPDYKIDDPKDEQDKDYWLTRKYRAQALQQEGELLDTSAVMRAWTQTIGEIRDQMLLLPAAVQGLLNLTDEQTRQLDDFLRRTLAGTADRVGDLADSAQVISSGGEVDTPAPAAESESMGGGSQVHAEVDDGGARPVEE